MPMDVCSYLQNFKKQTHVRGIYQQPLLDLDALNIIQLIKKLCRQYRFTNIFWQHNEGNIVELEALLRDV